MQLAAEPLDRGLVYRSSGRPYCCRTPAFSTAILSPIVIASMHRSIVPRVLAGAMAIWVTGLLARLPHLACYTGPAMSGGAGIQTRIAPGPRLSHWKYGIAVTVTARSSGPSAAGGAAEAGAVAKAAAGPWGACLPGTAIWMVAPMPGKVAACSVSGVPGMTASSSSLAGWSVCSKQ